MMKLIVHTDGASRGNPGHASYGFTINDGDGRLIHEEGKYIGIATNNVAEYTAVLEALTYITENLKQNLPADIEFHADSKLVAEQLSGRYKIKSPHLKEIIEKVKILAIGLGGVTYSHVPREENQEADRMANIALDKRL